ncbi:putative GTP-binding protein YjiA [compost metagenome]
MVLSKLDQASAEDRAKVEAIVREEVPAQVKIVAADQGKIDLGVVLGLSSASEETIDQRQGHHGHGDDHDEHDHDEFDSIVVKLPAVDRDALLATLARIVSEHTVYRVKGFVAVPAKPMRLVVHGVGTRFDSYFDRRWAAGETPQTHLVLIGHELDEAAITAELDQLGAR